MNTRSGILAGQEGSVRSSSLKNRKGPCPNPASLSGSRDKVIQVKELKKYFTSGLFRKTLVRAVDGVSFEIGKGETLGLVGESGSGKSTVGRCILQLIQPTSGEIFFNGANLSKVNNGMSALRKNMQIIFQDTAGALNPRMKLYDLLLEPLTVHGLVNGNGTDRVAELMERVNLPLNLMERYPHELSGGQRQRIGIARAISLNPEFIVADEAAASLDLLIQAQMLNLLKNIQSAQGISYLFISHNLNIIRRIADRVAVMYLGRFVEVGKTEEIFNNPVHPYTQALLSAVLSIDPLAPQKNRLRGEIPNPLQSPAGCRFHPRCPQAESICSQVLPPPKKINDDHWAWCHK